MYNTAGVFITDKKYIYSYRLSYHVIVTFQSRFYGQYTLVYNQIVNEHHGDIKTELCIILFALLGRRYYNKIFIS